MALRNMLTGGGGGYNPNPLAPSAGSDVFGSRPVIPDLDEAMRQALLANLGNFGDLASLGRRTTQANQQQLLNQLMATDPLFQERAALQGADIMAQLEGRLPDAAQRYLQQVASERNVGMGVGGSPFGQQAEYGLMHDAVLGQIQQGIQNANAFRQNLASTSTVPGYDLSRAFVSPEDQAQRNLLESYAAAAPDPAARGKYEEALAREFFNRAQQGARPQPVSIPGTTGTGAASGGGATTQLAPLTGGVPGPRPMVDPRVARQMALDRTAAARSANLLGLPAPRPTNIASSLATYGASAPAAVAPVVQGYQPPFAAPTTGFTPMLDSLRGQVSPVPDFSSPLSFSDQFSSVPYQGSSPVSSVPSYSAPFSSFTVPYQAPEPEPYSPTSFADFGLTLGATPAPVTAEAIYDSFFNDFNDSGFYFD